ncbi:unnamed protein product, partial [marine sediment metagenome]
GASGPMMISFLEQIYRIYKEAGLHGPLEISGSNYFLEIADAIKVFKWNRELIGKGLTRAVIVDSRIPAVQLVGRFEVSCQVAPERYDDMFRYQSPGPKERSPRVIQVHPGQEYTGHLSYYCTNKLRKLSFIEDCSRHGLFLLRFLPGT